MDNLAPSSAFPSLFAQLFTSQTAKLGLATLIASKAIWEALKLIQKAAVRSLTHEGVHAKFLYQVNQKSLEARWNVQRSQLALTRM